jgi:hypothetical protein
MDGSGTTRTRLWLENNQRRKKRLAVSPGTTVQHIPQNRVSGGGGIERFTYIRSKDKRSNDKRSNDQRPKDKRSNDKRSKDKRSKWTQGRIGTQHRMTEGRKGLKVERLNTEFERRKTEGRRSFLQFLKLY